MNVIAVVMAIFAVLGAIDRIIGNRFGIGKEFEKGITLEDGYICQKAVFKLIAPQKGNITIHEGKFHQIKRMFQSLGLEVTYLKRMKFGPIDLDPNLGLGEYRLLTDKEIELLKKHN